MAIRVGIEAPRRAFLPESHAYLRALQDSDGIDVRLVPSGSSHDLSNADLDVWISFRNWLQPRLASPPIAVVGDVASLSVGRFKSLKDAAKTCMSRRAHVRVIQSDWMAAKMGWQQGSYEKRSMGYFEELVLPRPTLLDFDLVYSGDTHRRGLPAFIARLAAVGFRIGIVGWPLEDLRMPGVELLGVLSFHDVYEVYSRSYAGLNWVPDREPWTMQQSTKVIEYLGSGLHVVSQNYPWIEFFCAERNLQVIHPQRLISPDDLYAVPHSDADIHDLSWTEIMRKLGPAELCTAAIRRFRSREES